MHWVSILTALVLALASSHLVFNAQWTPVEAFAVVGAGAFVLIVSLFVVLLILTPSGMRREQVHDLARMMREKARDFVQWILR